jgi:hypothetical protein
VTAPAPVLVADLGAGPGRGGGVRRYPPAVLADPAAEGRVVELGRLCRPRLRPGVAVVLGAPVGAAATPAGAQVAVAAAFLCVRVEADGGDGALLVGEDLLPDQAEGALRLDLDGRRLADVPVELPGPLPGRLAALGAEAGLAAGQVVVLVAAEAGPARPGVLQLTGPGGRTLVARLVDRVPAGAGGRDGR